MEKRLGFTGELATTAMGIMPHEDVDGALANRLESIWSLLEARGVGRSLIARNSMLAPATCNLLNIDKTVTVDNAFMLLKELSIYLKEKYL